MRAEDTSACMQYEVNAVRVVDAEGNDLTESEVLKVGVYLFGETDFVA